MIKRWQFTADTVHVLCKDVYIQVLSQHMTEEIATKKEKQQNPFVLVNSYMTL